GFECEGHAGAEDRIEEFGGVPNEGELGTVESRYRAGVATDAPGLKGESCAGQPAGRVRVALENRAELRFRLGRKALEKPGLGHRADAGQAIGKGDDPYPRPARMQANPDFSFVPPSRAVVTRDVGEEGFARWESAGRLEIQQPG